MKNRLNRILSVLLAALCALALPVPVFSADGGSGPLYAGDIRNGTYDGVEVESTSSMFRVVACRLTVTDDGMTAHMTLSGKGFGKLYLGRGEDALKEDESAFYPFSEDGEGRHTFDIPVEALDKPIPCAGWSIKREQWYDRDITFLSASLPDGAVLKSEGGSILPIIAGTAAVLAGGAALTVVCALVSAWIRKKKNAGGAS